jgi:hypothetical protein
MATSEARIRANQINAQKSTGPKTEAGKERSRANSLKHGMTGAGVVMVEADAAEVQRRFAAFAEETNATGAVGLALAHLAALSSVRMERGADQQAAALAEHVRQVEADFVPPEGVDEAQAAYYRIEAARRAMFDPSREATLARKYEAANQRTFLRCLKELGRMDRLAKREAKVDAKLDAEMMGSFLKSREGAPVDEDEEAAVDAIYAEMGLPAPPRRPKSPNPSAPSGGIDVPFSIGKRQ